MIGTDSDTSGGPRLRPPSMSLAVPASRSRLRSVSKKQAKELIRQETSHVILKKLANVLGDLGLQLPIPLKTTSGGSGLLKLMKMYVANTNDCIYLAPASSASFTYEDVENGGNDIRENTPRGASENGSRGASDPRGLIANPHALTAEPRALTGLAGTNWLDSENTTDSTSVYSGGMSDTEVDESPTVPVDVPLKSKIESFHLPNYLCTQIDSDSPIPHLFAAIVDLKKDHQIKNVHIDFLSTTSTLWPLLEPHNRFNLKERFKIGSLEWVLSMHDADYYISTTNSNNTRHRDLTSENLAKRTRKYRLASVRKLADGTDDINHHRNPVFVSSHLLNSDSDVASIKSHSVPEIFPAGIYVFLLPILLPPHIPASVNSVNGGLYHRLNVLVNKISEKLNRRVTVNSMFNLHMARTPPSLADCIADKPIYVNRVWNDALHYVITFPRKYISLGSEHTINIKLVPLVKDVIIKRIKFNVLERITYVSRDLSREYEYDGDDPYLTKSTSKNRERVVHVCELKTKNKSSGTTYPEPYKEEVIKCPENNILYSCYEPSKKEHDDGTVLIASPLDINIALPFLTSRSDKGIIATTREEPGDLDLKNTLSGTATHSRRSSTLGLLLPSSPIIGAHETHISHVNEEQLLNSELGEDVLALDSSSMAPNEQKGADSLSQGCTTTARALAPDSNFRHIQISHRLQVCFRISKPDPSDNDRMHHYEVVVDTPLILVSARCTDESIHLPHYDEINDGVSPPDSLREIQFRNPTYNKSGISIRPLNEFGDDQLPSFEEAVSTAASPMMRSVSLSENHISRMNSLTPSEPAPAYERSPSISDEVIPPLSIDDLVIDPSKATRHRRSSVIKTSLMNSIAPSSSTVNRSDGASSSSKSMVSSGASPTADTTGTSAITDSEACDKSYSEVPPSIPSLVSMISDAESSTPPASVMSPLESSSEEPESYAPGTGQSIADGTLEEQDTESVKELAPSRLADDMESVFTQDSLFVQKLPLLQNISLDHIQDETCYANRTNEDLSKMLTDTLNEEVQSPSMFHAY